MTLWANHAGNIFIQTRYLLLRLYTVAVYNWTKQPTYIIVGSNTEMEDGWDVSASSPSYMMS